MKWLIAGLTLILGLVLGLYFGVAVSRSPSAEKELVELIRLREFRNTVVALHNNYGFQAARLEADATAAEEKARDLEVEAGRHAVLGNAAAEQQARQKRRDAEDMKMAVKALRAFQKKLGEILEKSS
jgi:hypothetical protein